MVKQTAPFGLWPSPISARDLTRGARRFGHLQGNGPFLYWTEGRPEEKGRQVVVRARPGGPVEDMLAPPFSARSKVHEYGGAEFLVAGGHLFFVNGDDQDIWRLERGGKPERITELADTRFADMTPDAIRVRLIVVAERHAGGDDHPQPENLIAAVGLEGDDRGRIVELARGRDFYAFPRLSPDGTRLAFLAWDLPDMPWDQSALYVASMRPDGTAGRAQRIAGGDGVAAMQPEWLDDDRLVFLSDESGFGNLMIWEAGKARALTRLKAELGLPMWTLGSRTFAIAGPDRIVASGDIDGQPSLIEVTGLGERKPEVAVRPLNVASVGSLARIDGGVVTMIGRPKAPGALAAMIDARRSPAILRTTTEVSLEAGTISAGRTLSFRGGDRKTTFAQFYAPTSATHRGPRNALPPALVLAHGGPTAQAGRGLTLRVQYYTSRGFAVLDVDYSGSTGYGRAYRERLDGQWGVADVADCAAGAAYLASEGLADSGKIAIAGGSAGGYTVLMALATTKAFAAGSSHYGISDLSLLMESTHKFEAGYLHRLLATTPRSWKKTCAARSPLALIEGMTAPLILFQGLDDKVVPPEQSRLIHEQLEQRGIPTELHEFRGEAHGFRQADTIAKVAEAELAFLRRALALG
ncbi:MAG: prolyl oligopeptidase family serine peptidase [Hyphomicrobiaceae bacterium]|nr:prolyl oligopeptidase family serine peptidase [Hyphomicrobiaceae bacterium]